MSESKFTPGPWRRDKYGAIVAPNGEAASFRGVSILCSGPADRVTEAEANTDLAAAAPDLLDACRKALYLIKGREHDGFLREAIAKATGERP